MKKSCRYKVVIPVFLTTAISCALFFSSPASAVSTEGLVGYWNFDEGSGTVAGDLSGYGNTGTLKNGPAWTVGKIGRGALNFDGINDYVNISHSSFININGNKISISAWLKATSAGTWQTAVAKVNKDGTHTAPYFLYMLGLNNNNVARFFLAVGGGATWVDVVSNQALAENTWYHLVGTYDGVEMKIYVNGVQVGVRGENRNITSKVSSLRIGAGGAVSEPVKGVVDDVRLYNRALSAEEVQSLYIEGGGSPNPNPEPTPTLTWTQPIQIVGAPHVTTTVAGDFNGDGITDFAALEGGADSGGAKLFAWFESPNFIKHDFNPGFSTSEFTGSGAAADIDGDGDTDIVFSMDHHGGIPQEGWVYWAENPGMALATNSWNIHLIHKFGTETEHINDMAVADMDNDGKLDVVIRHLATDAVRIMFQDAPDSWTVKTILVRPREGLSVGDLDNDGGKDILLNGFWLAGPADPRTGTWTEYSIDPIFYTQPDSSLNNATKSSIADLDGDGLLDVVLATAEGSAGKLSWYKNPGNPRMQSWIEHILEPSLTGMHQAEVGDMDLDGNLDVMGGLSFGQTGIFNYLLQGDSFRKNVVTWNQGLYFGKLADLDADGDLDIVGPTSYVGQLYVYRNLGLQGGPDATPPVITFISASNITASTADINWLTSENADTQVEYGLSTNYGSMTPLSTSLVTSHAEVLSGLTALTVYHYRVMSKDASGNLASSSDQMFTTAASPSLDTNPPGITITKPLAGATPKRGNISISATAFDDVGVVGVTFYVDGIQIHNEITGTPYDTIWNATIGDHTLTARARDAADNSTLSAPIDITVIKK